MKTIQISCPLDSLKGTVALAGSKSISNRVLMIRAFSGRDFPIAGLGNAADTVTLQRLLASAAQTSVEPLDAGPAGTTFRFLTAYLAAQEGTQVLTGSERMQQRPIGLLVDALRELGARIDYLEKEGYPPLRIRSPQGLGRVAVLSIPADTSSQYITALLLLAPTLPAGLQLKLEGTIVSRPYIEMTLRLMQYFGVRHRWEGNLIAVPPQTYQPQPFRVEADWSAASYYYALAVLFPDTDLALCGLYADSLQGDAVLAEMMEPFGITTVFEPEGVRLRKNGKPLPQDFEYDFLRCPDLAQTLAVICAAVGARGRFSGLETLRIKETDRIAALQAELAKVGVALRAEDPGQGSFVLQGRAKVQGRPVFSTYHDHRMAMAFAPLSVLGDILVEDPEVVGKSYPTFWEDLRTLGFSID